MEKQHKNDHALELTAIKSYNEGIQLAAQLKDNGSEELLEAILKDEEDHIDVLEGQLAQIEQMGIKNYLAQQVG